jgi:hypothetical protein
MKYDDASWHSGGDFPKELPQSAGAIHTGMFVAWALLSGLGGLIHTDDFAEDLEALKARKITPGAYFLRACDGKFTDEDLNEQGNAFTKHYFDLQTGSYLEDYETILGQGMSSLYHVSDSWANFDRLKPVLDNRFADWRQG